MKITAQEEYGLRCLLQLAQADPESGLPVKEIASREGLSPAYVEKLLRLMGKAGLIHSIRGVHGGYRLTRKPTEISLGDVVRALSSLPSTEEICDRHTGNLEHCVHMSDCSIRSAWTTLTEAVGRFMEQVFIADLIGPERTVAKRLHARIETPFQV
ncbi:MAG: transcriptional regulator [Candidatus Omnitrophica bacterium CG11_big_fil_rev_8_21_14_0_20_64_10]|nr:MAG: transcriptional regulator [Candidatus Omnitrophica bacterium CG11_big_fil_rev_8_21_14_0_20_64_10]